MIQVDKMAVELHCGQQEGLKEIDAHGQAAVERGVQQDGMALGPQVLPQLLHQLHTCILQQNPILQQAVQISELIIGAELHWHFMRDVDWNTWQLVMPCWT